MYYLYRPSLRRQKNARICRALKNSGLENNLQKAQQITSNIGSWLVNALVSVKTYRAKIDIWLFTIIICLQFLLPAPCRLLILSNFRL